MDAAGMLAFSFVSVVARRKAPYQVHSLSLSPSCRIMRAAHSLDIATKLNGYIIMCGFDDE